MWVLFGNRTKARPVEGGRSQERSCPECKTVRRFVECDVEDQVSLFFVPVLTGITRRMVCTTCGEDLEVLPTPIAQPRAESQTAEAPKRASESEIETQLAALKKKMRK